MTALVMCVGFCSGEKQHRAKRQQDD